MSEQRKDPAEQLQVGARVLYLPEGVYAEINGYVWTQPMTGVATIVLYRLSCGINVGREHIEPAPLISRT